jgi:hypothetical protein
MKRGRYLSPASKGGNATLILVCQRGVDTHSSVQDATPLPCRWRPLRVERCARGCSSSGLLATRRASPQLGRLATCSQTLPPRRARADGESIVHSSKPSGANITQTLCTHEASLARARSQRFTISFKSSQLEHRPIDPSGCISSVWSCCRVHSAKPPNSWRCCIACAPRRAIVRPLSPQISSSQKPLANCNRILGAQRPPPVSPSLKTKKILSAHLAHLSVRLTTSRLPSRLSLLATT